MKNTPLHVAASAGHLDVVKYLVEECKVSPFIRDKYVFKLELLQQIINMFYLVSGLTHIKL